MSEPAEDFLPQSAQRGREKQPRRLTTKDTNYTKKNGEVSIHSRMNHRGPQRRTEKQPKRLTTKDTNYTKENRSTAGMNHRGPQRRTEKIHGGGFARETDRRGCSTPRCWLFLCAPLWPSVVKGLSDPGGLGETALPSPFVKFVPFVVSAVGLFPPCPLWLCESKSGTHVLTEAQRHRGRIRDGTRTSGDAFPPDRNPVNPV